MQLSMFGPANRDQAPFPAMADLIIECFSAPPWNEAWSSRSAVALATSLCAREFDLAAIIDQPSGRLNAMALGMPLRCYEHFEDLTAAGADGSSYYVPALASATSFRRQGGCSRCFDAILQRAKEQGFVSATVRTRHDNEQIFGIFRRHGFTQLGRMLARTGGVDSERVVFEKRL